MSHMGPAGWLERAKKAEQEVVRLRAQLQAAIAAMQQAQQEPVAWKNYAEDGDWWLTDDREPADSCERSVPLYAFPTPPAGGSDFSTPPPGVRWQLGDKVRKKRGSSWRGTVCGFYSTPHTPQGYCVDSAFEPGSVQVWPEAALEDWDGGSDAE